MNHQRLKCFQLLLNVARKVPTLLRMLPKGSYYLEDQLKRALASAILNLAEGNGRFTKADRRNFFTIARGSAQECVPLLEIARRREFINEGQHTELRAALEEVAKMLSGLINGLDKRQA